MERKVIVAGSGKLGTSLIGKLQVEMGDRVVTWDNFERNSDENVFIVHTGSGRQLSEIFDYCRRTKSPLLELSTGTVTHENEFDFPVILCPNTSILLLKFMTMIKSFGDTFSEYKVRIVESHQSTKKSVPGTAIEIGKFLKVPNSEIKSVRDSKTQIQDFGVPEEFLGKHAIHKVEIIDGKSSILLETKVFGHDSYSDGVKIILDSLSKIELESRKYDVTELVEAKIVK